MAWNVDRLGRSLQDLVGFLGQLHAAGVDLFLHQQGLDTTTPGGKAMFQMLGVFAEFELASAEDRLPESTHFADCDVILSEGEKCPQRRLWAQARSSGGVTARGRRR